jgi:hypothetical protein
LQVAANVFQDTVPIFFEKDCIRIKKLEVEECEYDTNPSRSESYICQIHFRDLNLYYCHTPIAFVLTNDNMKKFAKRHENQSSQFCVTWKFRRDDKITVMLYNDIKIRYKRYTIPINRSYDPPVYTPELEDELTWNIELKELLRCCDELNLAGRKNPSITFQLYENATVVFSHDQDAMQIFGMVAGEYPKPRNHKITFSVSLNCLRKVCSKIKKTKNQERNLLVSVDHNPDNYVRFSQILSDHIVFEWWLSKRNE